MAEDNELRNKEHILRLTLIVDEWIAEVKRLNGRAAALEAVLETMEWGEQ